MVGQELIGQSRTTVHAAANVLFNPSKTNLVDEPKIKLFILVLKHVAHTEWSFKLKYAFHFNELVGFVLSCSQRSVLLHNLLSDADNDANSGISLTFYHILYRV